MPAAIPGHRLVLTLDGTIDNREPVSHAVPLAWVPLERITAEGEAISAGTPLATLDTGIARFWDQDGRLKLSEARATQSLTLTTLKQKIADLEAKGDDLATQARVLDAQIAAARSKDDTSRVIAQLDVDRTERVLKQADDVLSRVVELSRRGHASPGDLAKVRQARDQAAADCVKPRITLELIAESSNDAAIQQLELERERVDDQLGAAGHSGLAEDLADLKVQLLRQERLGTDELARQEREAGQRKGIIDHPQVIALATGVVRYRDAEVLPGAKLPAASFAFVLTDTEMVAAVQLPESLRARVQVHDSAVPGSGEARVRIGALDDAVLAGHVLSIAAAPTSLPDGRRVFGCEIRFDDREAARTAVVKRVRPGMRVRCDLMAPVPPDAVSIPLWCVRDPIDPAVELADGALRRVHGFAAAPSFIVTRGLALEDALAAHARDDAPSGRLRLAGVLESTRALPLRLSSGGWELLEVVPDGALVEKGAEVARLGKASSWRDASSMAFEAELGAARARADFDVARADAEAALSAALVAWESAAIDAREKRLAADIAGTLDANAVIDAETAWASAQLTSDQAARDAVGIDEPAAVRAFSTNDVSAKRLALKTAAIGLDHARLQVAAADRSDDWLAVQQARLDAQAASEATARAREAYADARAQLVAAEANAQATLRSQLNKLRWNSDQIADEVVRAPRRGRVYHRLGWDWQPLVVGQEVSSIEPFLMPIGAGRRFTVEVPARLYGRFRAGEAIDYVLPLLGSLPRHGVVAEVGSWFADASSQQADPTAEAPPEKIFYLTVAFDLGDEDLDHVPLGAIAYVDL